MNTPAYLYNDSLFRAQCPAFAQATVYTPDYIQMWFDMAGLYINNTFFGPLAKAGAMLPALNMMTAHLLQINAQIGTGTDSGITVAAAIDKISTTLQEMTLPNQWQYWLASTEYGRMLLALLQAKSVGGFYTPGGLGRGGFRS